MSKISMAIIALYVITSSNFVIASDASIYEDYMLRIAKRIQKINTSSISFNSKLRYTHRELDNVADIATDYLGASALHKLRTIRNWVEVAPFRGQIVAIEAAPVCFSRGYKLAPKKKLNAGYISTDHTSYTDGSIGYRFYALLKEEDDDFGNPTSITDQRLADGSVKIRIATFKELIWIRRAIILRKADLDGELDCGLQKVEDRIIENIKEGKI